MLSDLTVQQKRLADLMSDISERCYEAGWMPDLEYHLWHALIHGPVKYGHGEVTKEDIDELKRLSEESSCWIIFDDDADEAAISITSWKAVFELDNNSVDQMFLGAA